jgi:hypothetical protein
MFYISGPGHAEYFLELAEKEGQGPALATFVRGKGYVKFEGNDGATLPLRTGDELADVEYGAQGTKEADYGK